MERGWLKVESLLDGTVTLTDLADLHDELDVIDENRRRHDEWVRQKQRG